MTIKRAILYPRVSTDEQAEMGYSLGTQLEACREYVQDNGFDIVAELVEDYTGTVPIEDRPEGSKAYAMLANDEADALIAYRIDRIVRPPEEGDEWDIVTLIRGLARLGKEIHTCDRGQLNTEFGGLLMAVLDAKSAGDERRKIIERSRRGKYGKAKKGKVGGGGRPPYGYEWERDGNGKTVSFAIVESEAAIVRLIYTWYVYGDEDGKPLSGTAIAKKLSEVRIKTPGETRKVRRIREPGMWGTWTVLDMLSNETYAGVWRFGTRIGNSRNERPLSEQVEVEIPAIIDRGLWDAAQVRREHNKKNSKRNAKRDYLLRGMIQCGCGKAMCGNFFSDHRYYTCTWRHNHHAGIEVRTCKQKSIRADLIEPIVWSFVMDLFSDAEKLEQSLRLAQQQEIDTLAPKRHELETVELMLAECEMEAAGYAEELVKTRGGKVRQALEARVEEFEERFKALSRQREKLQAELASGQRLDDESIRAALKFREDIYLGMQDPDYETKRGVLEQLGVQVCVNGRQARISCIFPTAEKEVGIESASYLQGTILPGSHFRAVHLPPGL